MNSYNNSCNRNSGYNRNNSTYSSKPAQTYKKPEPLNKTDYVDRAEKIIKEHIDNNPRKCITTNKIRNILTLMTELYNMARADNNNQLNEKTLSHIQYVKMKLVYESGREDSVKDFINCSGLLVHLDSIKNNKEELMLVCHYTEALVAYHKYYAPKER